MVMKRNVTRLSIFSNTLLHSSCRGWNNSSTLLRKLSDGSTDTSLVEDSCDSPSPSSNNNSLVTKDEASSSGTSSVEIHSNFVDLGLSQFLTRRLLTGDLLGKLSLLFLVRSRTKLSALAVSPRSEMIFFRNRSG